MEGRTSGIDCKQVYSIKLKVKRRRMGGWGVGEAESRFFFLFFPKIRLTVREEPEETKMVKSKP